MYSIQAILAAAVYAADSGELSKTATLLSKVVTVSIDVSRPRSADTYDFFDGIEDEVRKHTFSWCVYLEQKTRRAFRMTITFEEGL